MKPAVLAAVALACLIIAVEFTHQGSIGTDYWAIRNQPKILESKPEEKKKMFGYKETEEDLMIRVNKLYERIQKQEMEIENLKVRGDRYKELFENATELNKTQTQMVREFHKMTGQPAPDVPTLIDRKMYWSRMDLIIEELDEYATAVEEGNLVKITDALADLKYVVIGTEVVHGIPGEETFAEVHRSNMTKDVGWLDKNGKWQKGDNFEEPELEMILTRYGWTVPNKGDASDDN